MKRSAFVLALSALAVTCVNAQSAKPQTSAPAPFDSSKAYEHLRQMVAIGPRPPGSAALKQTRDYITKQMSAVGITVKEQPFTAQTPVGKIDMINLIATLPGSSKDRILLTGHYDTKLIKSSVFVGASDGASSAAILMELARVLKARTHALTYEFVWFDGEEALCNGWDDCKDGTGGPDNTYGSRYYVQAAQKDGSISSLKAMILFDMIGARDLKVQRDKGMSADWLIDLVWNKAKTMGHSNVFLPTDYGVGGDDHEPFFKAGIPSLDIIDLGDYPQWHNQQACCDDLTHVAARSLQVVADVVLASLPDIEKRLMK
jgi:Zn-dependent M28 family amino/carboxypeptidase